MLFVLFLSDRFYFDVLFLEVYLCLCDVLFVFILIHLFKDALQPNFQHVEGSCLKALLQIFPRFFSIVKLPIQTRNTREVLMRKWASQFKEIVIFSASSVYVSLFFL